MQLAAKLPPQLMSIMAEYLVQQPPIVDSKTGKIESGFATSSAVQDGAVETYAGYWQNGLPHGRGKQTTRDGSRVYDGHFVNGKRDGHGIYKYPKGGVYTGLFKNNKRHGQGVYTRPDGTIIHGIWKHGQRKRKRT